MTTVTISSSSVDSSARPVLELGKRAVMAEHRRLAHLQVDVAGARFGRIREQRVEIHGVIIGTPEPLL